MRDADSHCREAMRALHDAALTRERPTIRDPRSARRRIGESDGFLKAQKGVPPGILYECQNKGFTKIAFRNRLIPRYLGNLAERLEAKAHANQSK